MTNQEYQKWLMKVYPNSTSWKNKVHNMEREQLIAIYLSFQKRRLI